MSTFHYQDTRLMPVMVPLLLTLNRFSSVSIVDFEQVNVCYGSEAGAVFLHEVFETAQYFKNNICGKQTSDSLKLTI